MRKEKRIKLKFVGNQGQKNIRNEHSSFMKFFSWATVFVVFLAVTVGALPNRNDAYRSLLSTARAAPMPIKNFRFFQGKISDFFGKGYKLGDVFAMVDEGEKVGSELTFAQYIAVNIGANYFGPSALDILYLTGEMQSGKKPGLIKALSKSKQNHSLAFTAIPYKIFFEKSQWQKSGVWGYRDHSPTPQLSINYGMPKMQAKSFHFDIKFADGKVRTFQPNEPFLALLPNIQESISKSLPSLRPEEALPFALMYYSKFYNRAENKWKKVDELKKQIAMSYAVYAGIELDPEQIEVSGIGKATRFLYHGPVGGNQTYVYRQKKSEKKDVIATVPVPVVSPKKELMMFASMDPSQAIIIPISLLMEIGNDDLLLATNGSVFTYNDVLEEMAIAKDNLKATSFPLYSGRTNSVFAMKTSSLVVKTKRLEIISNNIIGDATGNKALARIKSFIDQTLPYATDAKRPGVRADIQMTPLNTFVNGAADCEDHAIPYASLVFSASIGEINNQYVGLMESSYINKDDEQVGHMSPLVMIPGRKTVTNPFPDHVLAKINGRMTPFFTVEATGLTSDNLGVVRMQRNAMEPNSVNIITGQGKNRRVYVAGLSEFKYSTPSI